MTQAPAGGFSAQISLMSLRVWWPPFSRLLAIRVVPIPPLGPISSTFRASATADIPFADVPVLTWQAVEVFLKAKGDGLFSCDDIH